MAIIWMDGFNNSGSTIHGRIYEIFNNTSFNLNSGRYDGGYIQMNATSSETTRIQSGAHKVISNTTTITVGVAIQSGNANNPFINGTSMPMIMLYNSAPGIAPVQNNIIAGCSISSIPSALPTNQLINIINRTGNLLSVEIPYLDPATWNYLEFEVTTGVSTGAARVYLNGKLVGSVSNVNFSTSTNGININKVGLLPSNYTTGSGTAIRYDDFYITNTDTRLGEIHISTIRPSADTAQKDWTPSTGSTNFSIVAFNNYENPNYITTNDHNKKDIYDLSNLSTLALQTNSTIAATRTTGAGYKLFFGGSNVNLIIKSGTTEINGPGLDLYEGSTAIFPLTPIINETNPDTTLAWTISDINNLQIGIKTN